MGAKISRQDLAKLPILGELSNNQLDQIRPHLALVSFRSGDNVLTEGEENDRLLCIASGKLRVWRKSGSTDLVLIEVGAGDTIGELTCLEPGPASATVTALEDGEAYVLSADGLRQLEQADPVVALAFFRGLVLTLGGRLRETTTLILAHKSMQEALLEFEELRETVGKFL